MKKFLIQSCLFVPFILCIGLLCDLCFSSYLKHNQSCGIHITESQMMHGEINADAIIMGSSRGVVQFDPHIIDSILYINSFNLALHAKTFYTQSMRYDVYRLHNKKPKLWIQHIDFASTLGLYHENRIDNLEANQELYYPYFWDRSYMNAINRQPFTWKEKYLPLYRYRGAWGKIPNPNNKPTYKGYGPKDTEWRGDNMPDTLTFYCFDEVKNLFCDYMAQAKADSIEVVFVYAPFYHKVIERVQRLEDCYYTFDSIAAANDIPILDYTYSYLSYDTLYFYDASHLNQRGAELFSTMLANDLDSLGIIH